MKIGEKIKSIRVAKGLDISNITELIEIDEDAYQKIENDELDITISTLHKIAEQLDCEVVDIFQHKEPVKGIKNYFYNHNGNSGTNIHIQGVDQEQIRLAYKEMYFSQIQRIPKLELLLRKHNIDFDF